VSPRHEPASGSLLLLREQFAWMGAHSGYDALFGQLLRSWPGPIESVHRRRSPCRNALLEPLAWLVPPRTPLYNGDSLAAEIAALRRVRNPAVQILHVAFVENNLRLISHRRRAIHASVLGTAHQPPGWWRDQHRHPELLDALDALVVLCRSQEDHFAPILPGRVHRIRHGVDTDFFSPDSERRTPERFEAPRCVFGGVWMRDLVTLRHAVRELLARRPDIHFDMIVPRDRRRHPEIERLARESRVTWHADLSSERLRAIYRRARMLLLPLKDSTANNTLLEAMACGLPIVTTRVGGVPEYVEPSFASCLEPGDVDGLVDAASRLVEDPVEAAARGDRARHFATRHLGWPAIAAEMGTVYRGLLAREKEGGSRAGS